MPSIKDISNALTKGPGKTSTDSKLVEAGIAGGLLLVGWGAMKALSNIKLNVNADANVSSLLPKSAGKEQSQKR